MGIPHFFHFDFRIIHRLFIDKSLCIRVFDSALDVENLSHNVMERPADIDEYEAVSD